MRLSLQQQSRAHQVIRGAILILWVITFAVIHSQAYLLYFIPFLVLITFFLLPLYSLVVAAVLLSGYLDGLSSGLMPATLKPMLMGAIWVAVLVVLGARAVVRRRRVTTTQNDHHQPVSEPEIPAPSTGSTLEPISSVSSEVTLSTHFRHDVRTPLNLILGFCEALLTPAPNGRQPVPAPFREDVEAIYRNGQQLKPLVEKLLENVVIPQADKSLENLVTARLRKTVILFDEDGGAFELFSHYIQMYDVIRVTSVEAIGRLGQDTDPLAIVISSDDTILIPIIAHLVGNTIPILTFNLGGAQSQMPFRGASDYLMKPVEFDALMAALERTGAALHTILVVDDNRDNMQMLSRMLTSLPEPPQILKAYSGREALALLAEEIPDVILLDFVLPDMDGRVMMDSLRAESRLARIPVLLVSAHRPSDILPGPTTTKLTLSRLAGISPIHLAQHIEALLGASDSAS